MIILASSLTLALDDPIGDPDGIFKKIIGYLDVSFTGLFSIELILKAIALGFLYNSNNPKNLDSLPKAYIRNSWNLLDIIVVLVYINFFIVIYYYYRMNFYIMIVYFKSLLTYLLLYL